MQPSVNLLRGCKDSLIIDGKTKKNLILGTTSVPGLVSPPFKPEFPEQKLVPGFGVPRCAGGLFCCCYCHSVCKAFLWVNQLRFVMGTYVTHAVTCDGRVMSVW